MVLSTPYRTQWQLIIVLENYQALLWYIFQTGIFLREMATLSFIYSEISSNAGLQSLKRDYRPRTAPMNMRPTPGTAPGSQLSVEVS